jgi:hypothetical protein
VPAPAPAPAPGKIEADRRNVSPFRRPQAANG